MGVFKKKHRMGGGTPHVLLSSMGNLAESLLLEKLKHLIMLVCHFYMFQNGVIDRQKGWLFINKITFILHKMLNLGFQNLRLIFLKSWLF